MSNTQSIQQAGFIRLPGILEIIPIGKSTWWAGVKSGRFPKPVKLGERTTAWRVEDIQALMNTFQGTPRMNKPVASSSPPVPACPPAPPVQLPLPPAAPQPALRNPEWVNRVAK